MVRYFVKLSTTTILRQAQDERREKEALMVTLRQAQDVASRIHMSEKISQLRTKQASRNLTRHDY